MRNGLVRKACVLVILWTLYYTAHGLIPMLDPEFVNPYVYIEPMISGGFVVYEAISLLENMTILGVKIPESITKHFAQLKSTEDKRK